MITEEKQIYCAGKKLFFWGRPFSANAVKISLNWIEKLTPCPLSLKKREGGMGRCRKKKVKSEGAGGYKNIFEKRCDANHTFY